MKSWSGYSRGRGGSPIPVSYTHLDVYKRQTYGNTLNRETVLNAVKQAVSENRTELNVEEVEGAYAAPSVTQADETLTQRAQELNNLISSSITYILPTGSQVLNSETLVTWLSRDENGHYYKDDTVWNQNITQYVANLAAAVDTVGTDRQFSATGLGTITVGGGVYGWQIDQDSEEMCIRDRSITS